MDGMAKDERKDMEEEEDTSSDEGGVEVSEEDMRSMSVLQSELEMNPLQYDKHLEVRSRRYAPMNQGRESCRIGVEHRRALTRFVDGCAHATRSTLVF